MRRLLAFAAPRRDSPLPTDNQGGSTGPQPAKTNKDASGRCRGINDWDRSFNRAFLAVAAIVTAFVVQAQPPKITEEKVYGREAWVLSNGLIRVALLKGGGHIAEVRQTTGDPKRGINPMRVPHYPDH